jgi:hypothetical protein
MVKKKIIESVTATDSKSRRWKSLFTAGKIAYENGEWRQAESLLARARELARELPESSFAVPASEIGVAVVALARRQAQDAASRLQKCVSELRNHSKSSHKELLAVALRFHAQALVDVGDERNAEKELQESASILSELGVDAGVQLAYTLCDLCGVYLMQGRISDAEDLITSAMEILFAVLGPESAEYARADMIYAVCREPEEQLSKTSEGIERLEYVFGDRHPNVSRVLGRYLKVLAERGEATKLDEAKERFLVGGNALKKQQT